MPRHERQWRPSAGSLGRAALTLLLSALFGCQVLAQARPIEAPVGETACSFGAFVTETDPKGLNVRSGPGTNAAIVGRLLPISMSKSYPDIPVMAEVEIVAGAKGWFKIRNARDNTSLTGAKARTMYAGTGWVSGQKLTVKTQATEGRAQPKPAAEVIFKNISGAPLDDERLRDAARLIGCSGSWALVEYGPLPAEMEAEQSLDIAPAAKAGLPQGRFRSWVDRICALQETSCSGF